MGGLLSGISEVGAALLGAAIGAIAGLAGGAFSGLASMRASQLAARAPLAEKIHELNKTVVTLRGAVGSPTFNAALNDFSLKWNDFIVHQKILAPSHRIGLLSDIVLAATIDAQVSPNDMVRLIGDSMNAVTEMIAQQSMHMFRWRARLAERGITERFRAGTIARLTSPRLRAIASEL